MADDTMTKCPHCWETAVPVTGYKAGICMACGRGRPTQSGLNRGMRRMADRIKRKGAPEVPPEHVDLRERPW